MQLLALLLGLEDDQQICLEEWNCFVRCLSRDPSDLLKVKRIMATISIQPPPKQASSDKPKQ